MESFEQERRGSWRHVHHIVWGVWGVWAVWGVWGVWGVWAAALRSLRVDGVSNGQYSTNFKMASATNFKCHFNFKLLPDLFATNLTYNT